MYGETFFFAGVDKKRGMKFGSILRRKTERQSGESDQKMDNLPKICYTDGMKSIQGYKQDGFRGETLIVLPPESFAAYADHPVVRRLHLTDAGYFPRAAGKVARPQGIAENILLCCTDGRGVVEVDGVLFTLAANEALCIPARCPHRYEADRAAPWSLVWVHFTGEDCAFYPLNPPRVCRLSAPDTAQRVEFLFSVLFDTLQEDYTLGNFICLSQVLGMILAEIYARTPAPDAQQRLVSRAIRLMAARVDGTLTLPELCSALQRSKSSVSAAFRRCTGRAPMDFFLRLKMQEACRRLCADRRTVSEVARSLGYQDPYYFSRLFKKVIGVGPRATRDATRAEEAEPLKIQKAGAARPGLGGGRPRLHFRGKGLPPPHRKAEHGAANAAHNMHEVGRMVCNKQNIIDLLAQVKRGNKDQSQRDAPAAGPGQARQHNHHEHNAGSPQQRAAGEQYTLQYARNQRCECNAQQQRAAAVAFLKRRAHDKQQQHVAHEMLPPGVAQHMAEQPHKKERVRHR